MRTFNWKSMKLLYAAGASVLLTAAWFATSHWTSLSPQFAIYKDGIVAIASFYLCVHAVSDVGQAIANKGNPPVQPDLNEEDRPRPDLSKIIVKGSPK